MKRWQIIVLKGLAAAVLVVVLLIAVFFLFVYIGLSAGDDGYAPYPSGNMAAPSPQFADGRSPRNDTRTLDLNPAYCRIWYL